MFLGANELKVDIPGDGLITPFEPKRIKQAAYELALGEEVFRTDSKTVDTELLDGKKKKRIRINPGQFALLLTAEKVKVPDNKLAFISVKAKIKLKGLINVSGFHVDPGWNDHLLFSVYNAGPRPIILEKGQPSFLIWFSELKSQLTPTDLYNDGNEHFRKLNHIPTDKIEDLANGDLASPNVLLEMIRKNSRRLTLNWMVVAAFVALTVSLNLDILFDKTRYREGYEAATRDEELTHELKFQIQKLHKRIDSLNKVKINTITPVKRF